MFQNILLKNMYILHVVHIKIRCCNTRNTVLVDFHIAVSFKRNSVAYSHVVKRSDVYWLYTGELDLNVVSTSAFPPYPDLG